MGFKIPSAINSRDFRLYIAGQIISLTGTWMQSVAQNWLVWSITGSSFYLGVVNGASSLPMLLFTIFGGIVADRFAKRRILIFTQTLSAIPALMLGLFVDLDIITIWYIVVSAFFLGTINAFDVPVRQSFLIDMVGRESLTGAIALNSAVFNGARLIGPVVAGLILSLFSISTCFYINALSYLAVVVALFMLRTEGFTSQRDLTIIRGLMDAIRFVISNKRVFYLLLLVMIFSVVAVPYAILLPAITEQVFRGEAGLYGFLMGAVGGGSFTAALFMAFRSEVADKRRFVEGSTVVFSVFLFLFSLSRDIYFSLVLLFGIGFSMISFFATANSVIQHSTPDYLRGRVMSLYTLVFLGMAPIGNFTVGVLASLTDALTALKMISFITIGAGMLLHGLFKKYDSIEML